MPGWRQARDRHGTGTVEPRCCHVADERGEAAAGGRVDLSEGREDRPADPRQLPSRGSGHASRQSQRVRAEVSQWRSGGRWANDHDERPLPGCVWLRWKSDLSIHDRRNRLQT